MKVVIIADFKKNDQINGGYFQATQSIYNSLIYAKDKKVIKEVIRCDFSEIRTLQEDSYDYSFIVCNPNSFISSFNYFLPFLTKCKNNYLHILWETVPLPSSWNALWSNNFITGFFTPSNFFKKELVSKTNKPVYFTPYIVEVNDKNIIDIDIKEKEENFTVLVMGQNTLRKGIKDAITSYIRAFSNYKSKSMLLVKSFQLSKYETPIEEMIVQQTYMNCKSANNLKIFTISSELNRDEINELYKKSSLLLMPSRGEGFCLPVAEAMSVGLPIIYTNWSNIPEVVCPTKCEDDININIAIDYTFDDAVDMMQYGYDTNCKYAVPKISEIVSALQLKNQEWLQDKVGYYKNAKQNIDTIKKHFSVEKVHEYYEKIFKGE